MIENRSAKSRSVPTPAWFADAFLQISGKHPAPEAFRLCGETAYRFPEPSTKGVILLKLARYISGLNAGTLLLSNGFLQELCTLQRTLDEIHEDILFLSFPNFGFPRTPEHQSYVSAFWEEEPEFSSFSTMQKNRHQLPRKKIRSYLSKINSNDEIDHSAIATSGYLSRIYSGYVHAAGPQLFELFDPNQTTFQLNGYESSPLLNDHTHDFENQKFRGVITVYIVARVFEAHSVAVEAFNIHKRLEHQFHS